MTTVKFTVPTALLVGFIRTASAQPTEPAPEPTPEPEAPAAPEAPPAPTPTPEPAPAATPAPAASDDLDLAALGLDPGAFDDKLNIYGFADFTYTAIDFRRPSPLATDTRNFAVGNLNIYLSKNLTPKWRTLSEIRFLFSPNGGTNADGSVTDTTTPDPANTFRPIEVGSIRIERVYLEYDIHPKVTIRAGHFLSPYGIWNIDHGSPAIIPVQRPYVIGEQFIPEHQTGIEAFGSTYLGTSKFSYHATVSNGRYPAEATQDPDMKLAFGGRVAIAMPVLDGTLSVGVSGYMGRSTALETTVLDTTPVASDDVSYAADLVFQRGGLHLQGELMGRDRDYLTGRRPTIGTGFAPNGRDIGAYALVGYRFERAWNVMPFALTEYYHPIDRVVFAKAKSASVGLNFRPTPSIVLKASATYADTDGTGQYGELGTLLSYATQAAWVF